MKCPECGSESSEVKEFCGDCGTSLAPPKPSQQGVQESKSSDLIASKREYRMKDRNNVATWILVLVLVIFLGVAVFYLDNFKKHYKKVEKHNRNEFKYWEWVVDRETEKGTMMEESLFKPRPDFEEED